MTTLDALLRASARRDPERLAVDDVRYGDLDQRAAQIAGQLYAMGVRPEQRVALWMHKSADAIATMQAVLRLGAAYVPIDPLAPVARVRRVVEDCAPAVVVVDAPVENVELGAPAWPIRAAAGAAPRPPDIAVQPTALAYILYTSGSTGAPKGVAVTHAAARAFVDWAGTTVGGGPEDNFASHAPLHFDLSVLDLYAAFAVGARVSLVPHGSAFDPRRLVEFIRRRGVSIWYSVPSAIQLMTDAGGLLDASNAVRVFAFAGEVFPATSFWRLYDRFPDRRYFNLYGPTETNVCTAFEVRGRLDGPLPIGRACAGNAVWAETEDGRRASLGEEGELVVEGPTVMQGYWGGPPANARFETGDVVRVTEDGFVFVGRRDGLLKVRGQRIEAGEVEGVLLRHPEICEAAVVVSGSGLAARLSAYVVQQGAVRPRLLDVKRHCAQELPTSIDALVVVEALPRTSSGKVDRAALSADAGKRQARRTYEAG